MPSVLTQLPVSLQTIGLLVLANVFTTFAWGAVYFIFRSA